MKNTDANTATDTNADLGPAFQLELKDLSRLRNTYIKNFSIKMCCSDLQKSSLKTKQCFQSSHIQLKTPL